MKKKNKIISIFILASLLFSNINSIAKTPYLDRYESLNGDNLTIDNILEEQNVDISIEGNSLVNLADIQSSFEIRNLNWYYQDYMICETSKLKLNTDYSFIIEKELLDNHSPSYNIFEVGVGNILNDSMLSHPEIISDDFDNSDGGCHFEYDSSKKKEYLKLKVRFTDFKGYKYLAVRPIRRYTNSVDGEYANANIKVILLEGDYTDKDIDYFKGIKSVGEENNKLQFKYTNKNIYPYGDITSNWNNESSKSLIGWIKVKPNTTYTVSVENTGGLIHFLEFSNNNVTFSNHNNGYLARDGKEIMLNSDEKVKTFTTEQKINYLYVTVSSGATETKSVVHSNIMLEESDEKTKYESYKETVIDIDLNEPLRGIPDGKKDKIIKKDGKWYIERNCEKVIVNLNNSGYAIFNWDGGFDTSSLYGFGVSNPNVLGTYENLKYDDGASLSDIWRNIGHVTSTEEGAGSALTASPPYIAFKLEKSKIDAQHGSSIVEKIRNYLKSLGDMTFIFEKKNPTYELLNVDFNIPLYLESTHIDIDSDTHENIIVKVDRAINNAVYYTELLNENPTVENISNARFWSNMLGESLKKDEIQNQINNLTEIKDLKIDKKTATVSTDIYIKFKNYISMSLDTNSIVFEDYNMTEDVEKLEAVNLTVTSSLPYKLNAYLEEEISNADNTSIIDKSILNLRLSNTEEYKAFTDLKTPITLIDNENDVNNKIHKVDLRLSAGKSYEADVYKTVIKFEVEQK